MSNSLSLCVTSGHHSGSTPNECLWVHLEINGFLAWYCVITYEGTQFMSTHLEDLDIIKSEKSLSKHAVWCHAELQGKNSVGQKLKTSSLKDIQTVPSPKPLGPQWIAHDYLGNIIRILEDPQFAKLVSGTLGSAAPSSNFRTSKEGR